MKHIRLLCALALSALLLTACGGKPTSDTSQPSTASEAPAASADTTHHEAVNSEDDTFTIDLFTNLIGIGKAGLVEQMGEGTASSEGVYCYEGVLFGDNVTAEVKLDGSTVSGVDIQFPTLSADELQNAADTLPEQPGYRLECEASGNGSILHISGN
ncbi:MAG: hypothetical protein ACI4PQ_04165 [Butyricicoccaceae bacterium]